nr:TPA_asm: fusion protein [Arceuthobium sichuanense virus 4]
MASTSRALFAPPSDAELQDQLDSALEPMGEYLPDMRQYTVKSVNENNYTVESFIKAMRPLVSYCVQGTFDRILGAGSTMGVVKRVTKPTTADLINLSYWVRSKQGQGVLTTINVQRKLEKKAGAGKTAADMAWTSIYAYQQTDWARERRAIQNDADVKLDKLRLKMAKIQSKADAEIAVVDKRYPVQSQFAVANRGEFGNLCWAMYQKDCVDKGIRPKKKKDHRLGEAVRTYSTIVRDELIGDYCQMAQVRKELERYAKAKIAGFNREGNRGAATPFATSLLHQLEQHLLVLPLKLRKLHLEKIPVGIPNPRGSLPTSTTLSAMLCSDRLKVKTLLGRKPIKEMPLQAELVRSCAVLNIESPRVRVLRKIVPLQCPLIPRARSKWEAGVRRIIGGGEMISWHSANDMYRGGGHLYDALRLLSKCDCADFSKRFLGSVPPEAVRDLLHLPSGLMLPDSRECFVMKNFNDNATAGPVCRAFGIKRKCGLKSLLEDYSWRVADDYASGRIGRESLPYFLARIGYRSKLVTKEKAAKKIMEGDSIGRAVMMMDAYEQSFCTPIYNIISDVIAKLHKDPKSGWKNYLVRASSDWALLFSEMKKAKTVVELDWSKFDRERPKDHILFFIDVIMSCFSYTNKRERRIWNFYRLILRRALVERLLLTDDGAIIDIDGMLPSGSLWTGIFGTGLNIYYIRLALLHVGVTSRESTPQCAGDDNLTFFDDFQSTAKMELFRRHLNEMFRANIEPEDFIVHYPPYHVTKVQAVFPKGVDLSLGTSKVLEKCTWVEFDGEPIIDEARGLSHRWEYRFKGKPKFLANYWLFNGRCIRPAADSLERVLWPEAIHSSIEDYEMAVLAMVVDNPWNSHNVNHAMHRYCIIQQIRRQAALGMKAEEILWYSKFKSHSGEPIPYPMIAYWRRQADKVHMEQVPELREFIDKFKNFVYEVSSLYGRKSEGGMDAWLFMDIIRGERELGSGQFGNDIEEWCDFLRRNPLTKSLRPVKRFREPEQERRPIREARRGWRKVEMLLTQDWTSLGIKSAEDFAYYVSNLYLGSHAATAML